MSKGSEPTQIYWTAFSWEHIETVSPVPMRNTQSPPGCIGGEWFWRYLILQVQGVQWSVCVCAYLSVCRHGVMCSLLFRCKILIFSSYCRLSPQYLLLVLIFFFFFSLTLLFCPIFPTDIICIIVHLIQGQSNFFSIMKWEHGIHAVLFLKTIQTGYDFRKYIYLVMFPEDVCSDYDQLIWDEQSP